MNTELREIYLPIISNAAIVVCAATGALAAARKQMDLVGAITLAIVTAIGGGTLRDLLIGLTPVFWIHDQLPLWIAAGTGVVVFAVGQYFTLRPRMLLIPDAVGLALFTWLGCDKSSSVDSSSTGILMMGVITGTAGGIIRDVLSDNVPSVFVKSELYATASFIGSLAFVVLRNFEVSQAWVAVACIGLVLIVRLSSIRWNITLPVYRGSVSE